MIRAHEDATSPARDRCLAAEPEHRDPRQPRRRAAVDRLLRGTPTPAAATLHHNFVVALLNDLFGIQSRGGCSCAGPYGHRLLGIDSTARTSSSARSRTAARASSQAGCGSTSTTSSPRPVLRLHRRRGAPGRRARLGAAARLPVRPCHRAVAAPRRAGRAAAAAGTSSRTTPTARLRYPQHDDRAPERALAGYLDEARGLFAEAAGEPSRTAPGRSRLGRLRAPALVRAASRVPARHPLARGQRGVQSVRVARGPVVRLAVLLALLVAAAHRRAEAGRRQPGPVGGLPRLQPPPVSAPGPLGSPDVVVIVTDDQRVWSLDRMSHVQDLLVARGRSYSAAMVPTSLCCPSRASLLTGRYSHQTGVWSNSRPTGGWWAFHEQGNEDRTLAVALHQQGYRTALVGKYFNSFANWAPAGYRPPGWDEFTGVPDPEPLRRLLRLPAQRRNRARVGPGRLLHRRVRRPGGRLRPQHPGVDPAVPLPRALRAARPVPARATARGRLAGPAPVRLPRRRRGRLGQAAVGPAARAPDASGRCATCSAPSRSR